MSHGDQLRITLLDAAKVGNASLVKSTMLQLNDIDVKDEFGRTALMYAAMNNHIPVLQLLAANGANINAMDDGKLTAAMHAAQNRAEKAFTYLNYLQENQGATNPSGQSISKVSTARHPVISKVDELRYENNRIPQSHEEYLNNMHIRKAPNSESMELSNNDVSLLAEEALAASEAYAKEAQNTSASNVGSVGEKSSEQLMQEYKWQAADAWKASSQWNLGGEEDKTDNGLSGFGLELLSGISNIERPVSDEASPASTDLSTNASPNTTGLTNLPIAPGGLNGPVRAPIPAPNSNQFAWEDPEAPMEYNRKGLINTKQKKYKDAISNFDRAIEIDPSYATAFYNRGNAKCRLLDYTSAKNDFDQAIRLNPHQGKYWTCRGNVHSELKEFPDALQDYQEALKIDSKNKEANDNQQKVKRIIASSWSQKGFAFGAKHDYAKAVECFTNAASYAATLKDKARYLCSRGSARQKLNQLPEAILDYNEVLATDPKMSIAFNHRGIAYAAQNDFPKALTDFSSAIALDTEVAMYYMNRGNTYSVLRDFVHALDDYQRALQLQPDNEDIKKNLLKARTRQQQYARKIDQARAQQKKAHKIHQSELPTGLPTGPLLKDAKINSEMNAFILQTKRLEDDTVALQRERAQLSRDMTLLIERMAAAERKGALLDEAVLKLRAEALRLGAGK